MPTTPVRPAPSRSTVHAQTTAATDATPDSTARRWFGGWLLVGAASLVAYPALRPYGPESGLEGARDFASNAWVVSHLLGVLGFVALAMATRVAARSPHVWAGPWADRRRSGAWAHATETRAWWAVALLLPYYGAEAFGLSAVAREALERGDTSLLVIADDFRYSTPALTTFSLGLVALLLVGGRLAHGTFAAGGPARLGGLLAGFALATYSLQFFLPPAGRIAHGVVLAAGLALVAWGALRSHDTSTGTSTVTGTDVEAGR